MSPKEVDVKVQLSKQKLAQHINDLAAAFKVVLIIDPTISVHQARNVSWHVPKVGVVKNEVYVPPITCELTYAAALHELGHAISPTGQLRGTLDPTGKELDNGNLLLDEESAAWDWARHNALTWTKKMEESAQWAYSTHVQAVRERDLLKRIITAAPAETFVGKKVTINPARPPQSLGDFIKKIMP